MKNYFLAILSVLLLSGVYGYAFGDDGELISCPSVKNLITDQDEVLSFNSQLDYPMFDFATGEYVGKKITPQYINNQVANTGYEFFINKKADDEGATGLDKWQLLWHVASPYSAMYQEEVNNPYRAFPQADNQQLHLSKFKFVNLDCAGGRCDLSCVYEGSLGDSETTQEVWLTPYGKTQGQYKTGNGGVEDTDITDTWWDETGALKDDNMPHEFLTESWSEKETNLSPDLKYKRCYSNVGATLCSLYNGSVH